MLYLVSESGGLGKIMETLFWPIMECLETDGTLKRLLLINQVYGGILCQLGSVFFYHKARFYIRKGILILI